MKKAIILFLCINFIAQAVLRIGHRGACGYKPENTICSFKKAIELGVDMIEFDVFVCASGQVVVFHDETVDRMTNGTGLITEKTVHELKQLVIKDGASIVTLREVLDFIDRRVKVIIELKGPGTAQPVAKIVQDYVTTKGWAYNDFLFMALDHHKLQEVHKLLPDARLAPCLIGIPLDMTAFAERMQADVVVAVPDVITQAYVDDAHKRGLKIFVAGHNKETIKKMKLLGVDGILSNYPDLIE